MSKETYGVAGFALGAAVGAGAAWVLKKRIHTDQFDIFVFKDETGKEIVAVNFKGKGAVHLMGNRVAEWFNIDGWEATHVDPTEDGYFYLHVLGREE